ncbi:MAG: LPS export ABC transporter periplasmic protein LptC [Magnetococcales bacterium]|nr:LPS export ABC transporter periplasmic protein LptC [Magnetococcales bacterium]
MKRPVKTLLIAIPLLVVGVVVWYLQHPNRVSTGSNRVTSGGDPCRSMPTTAAANKNCAQAGQESEPPATATQVNDLQLTQLAGERTEWRLLAPFARDDGKNKIMIQQPDLLLYGSDGQLSAVTAQEGTVNSQTQVMTFSGQVVATSDQQRLTSEILHFDPARKMLYTQQPFVLVDETMQLEGVGFALLQEKQSMIVQQKVRVHYFAVGDEEDREEEDGATPRS